MVDWIERREAEAAARVKNILSKPLPACPDEWGADDRFDPWRIFPSIYGTYSSDFGETVLTVLRNLQLARERRYDERAPEELPHQIFREMLCTADLCDYGTSPRGCFATENFAQLLPELIDKWEAFEAVLYGEAVDD